MPISALQRHTSLGVALLLSACDATTTDATRTDEPTPYASSAATVAAPPASAPSPATVDPTLDASAATRAAPTSPAPTLSRTDPRVLIWLDPRMPWASHAQATFYQKFTGIGGSGSLTTVPEPGLHPKIDGVEQTSEWQYLRTADPVDPSKHAFRLKAHKAWDRWNANTSRAEMGSGELMKKDVAYWWAVAYHFGADCYGTGGDNIDLADFHELDWLVPSTTAINPSTAIHLSDTYFWSSVRWEPNSPPLKTNYENRTNGAGSASPWREAPPPSNEWHYVIRKVKLSHLAANDPYQIYWRASGTAPPKEAGRREGPNAYNMAPATGVFTKAGIYMWSQNWGSSASRTVHMKGPIVIRAEAPAGGAVAIDENVVLATVREM